MEIKKNVAFIANSCSRLPIKAYLFIHSPAMDTATATADAIAAAIAIALNCYCSCIADVYDFRFVGG